MKRTNLNCFYRYIQISKYLSFVDDMSLPTSCAYLTCEVDIGPCQMFGGDNAFVLFSHVLLVYCNRSQC